MSTPHPLKECGKHHPTDEPGHIADYRRCCCGDTWLARARACVSGARVGDAVITDELEFLRKQAADAPYLRIQLDGLWVEVQRHKEAAERVAEPLAREMWREIGMSALVEWRRRCEAAEALLTRYRRRFGVLPGDEGRTPLP